MWEFASGGFSLQKANCSYCYTNPFLLLVFWSFENCGNHYWWYTSADNSEISCSTGYNLTKWVLEQCKYGNYIFLRADLLQEMMTSCRILQVEQMWRGGLFLSSLTKCLSLFFPLKNPLKCSSTHSKMHQYSFLRSRAQWDGQQYATIRLGCAKRLWIN